VERQAVTSDSIDGSVASPPGAPAGQREPPEPKVTGSSPVGDTYSIRSYGERPQQPEGVGWCSCSYPSMASSRSQLADRRRERSRLSQGMPTAILPSPLSPAIDRTHKRSAGFVRAAYTSLSRGVDRPLACLTPCPWRRRSCGWFGPTPKSRRLAQKWPEALAANSASVATWIERNRVISPLSPWQRTGSRTGLTCRRYNERRTRAAGITLSGRARVSHSPSFVEWFSPEALSGGVFWYRAVLLWTLRGNMLPPNGISVIAGPTRIRKPMNLFGPSGIYY